MRVATSPAGRVIHSGYDGRSGAPGSTPMKAKGRQAATSPSSSRTWMTSESGTRNQECADPVQNAIKRDVPKAIIAGLPGRMRDTAERIGCPEALQAQSTSG